MRALGGYSPDWEPHTVEQRHTEAEQLEGLEEIEKIMPLPPGFRSLADWKRAVRGRIQRRRGG